jgi:lipopolysaccharide/colanic/teichoic acid biosynthesis glycosyltransferase
MISQRRPPKGSVRRRLSPRISKVPAPLFRRNYRWGKRCLDLALTLLLLPVVMPVMLVCGALIWLEDGRPIFYPQPRTGRGGRRFKMFKLRTMVREAEARREEVAHLNELTYPDFKISSDPRVTRIGRFLRRASLDELPQVFNVLRGEMSLVGPRPTSFIADTYDLWQTERLEVLPGITGYWQVSGRSDVDFEERVRMDIYYIENCCLSLDLLILFKTLFAVTGRRGAY